MMLRTSLRALATVIAVGVCLAGRVVADESASDTTPPPQPADALFDDTVLHEIRLAINTKDWESLKTHYMENTYYPCDLRWRDQVVRNIGIRSRGTGSRNGVKPGLRIDFDRFASDQKFLGLKSFVLRNNTQDPSNLHERLSMLLFRRMGLPASREAHTTLYVNNQYVGLFSIVESVDKRFLQRAFGEDEGYLFKYDFPVDAVPYQFDYRGSNPDLYVPLPFNPETHEDDPRPEFVEQLIWTINETSQAVFRTAIAEYLDLRKFIRHVAIENFLADADGFLGDWGTNNFYLYRFDNRKLFTFIAWDKSEAFKGGIGHGILHNIADVPSWRENQLMRRAMSERDLYDLYFDTLLECARSTSQRETPDGPGWLELEIRREYAQVRDAVLADQLKPYTNDEFTRAIEDLVAFARERGEFVRQEVNRVRAEVGTTISARTRR
jgi:spore coat protein CotH